MNSSLLNTATILLNAQSELSVQEEGGSGIFLILFLLALLAAGGMAFYFITKINQLKEEQANREAKQRKEFETHSANLQGKLQTYRDQGREIYAKLKQTIEQNQQIKAKFQKAYNEITAKYNESQKSLSTLKSQNGFQAELDKVHHQLEDAQAMVLHAEKMSSLGQLTAGIAHEINNPVNFVSNGINTLKENFEQVNVFIENYRRICEQETLEDVKKYYRILRGDDREFETIQKSIEESLDDVEYGTTRITEIVHGLRIFSRQDEQDIKESHIHEIIDNALLILKPKYKKKAKVLKDFDHTMPHIKCLPGQLNQALVNLIGNASDAIDFKGTITIRTVNLNDEMFEVQIQDDGKGIPEDVQKKIFDPFFTTKAVGKGTGLGLSITYGIIEKHGGTIKVDSMVGKGTVFTVTLPKKIRLKKKTE